MLSPPLLAYAYISIDNQLIVCWLVDGSVLRSWSIVYRLVVVTVAFPAADLVVERLATSAGLGHKPTSFGHVSVAALLVALVVEIIILHTRVKVIIRRQKKLKSPKPNTRIQLESSVF